MHQKSCSANNLAAFEELEMIKFWISTKPFFVSGSYRSNILFVIVNFKCSEVPNYKYHSRAGDIDCFVLVEQS